MSETKSIESETPAAVAGAARGSGAGETLYPCVDCGTLRTKAEGGTTFTVCDECWEKHYAKHQEGKRPNDELTHRR